LRAGRHIDDLPFLADIAYRHHISTGAIKRIRTNRHRVGAGGNPRIVAAIELAVGFKVVVDTRRLQA